VGKFDNLNDSQVPDLIRRIERLERAAPMNNAAVGRGGFEVYDGGMITISNGGLKVTGSIDVIGELIASGTLTFTGTLTQEGESTFTGPTHFEGNTDVTGDFDVDGPMTTTSTLDVEGVTNLKNDVNVTGGGKITAGNTKISPSASNGGVEFVSGGGVGGSGGVVAIKGSGNAGLITDTTASVFAGANSVDVSPSAVTINGPLKATGITSTGSAANMFYDTVTKQIYYKP